MNLYEFHPVSLATPLLLYAFLFAWRRQYLPFVLCSLAAIGTKEQIGLVVAMFGLYIALVNRDWAIGLVIALVGASVSLFAAFVVEPHFRQPGSVTYLHSRYGYLGHGVRGVLSNVLHHPGLIAGRIFIYAKAAYLRQLLAPTGYLAFFAVPLLALVLPSLLLNLLSATPAMYSALGQDSAEMISAVVIASILGCRVVMQRLGPRLSWRGAQLLLSGYVLVAALWNQRQNGFTPIGERFQVPTIAEHQRIENRFVSMVPPSVPVSTQDELDPPLSSRHYLYLFGDTGRPPDPPLAPASYVLLDVSGPTYPLTSTELHLKAETLLHRRGWGVAAAQDGLILIEKGATSRRLPSRFYTYMRPSKAPLHRVELRDSGLEIYGYDVAREDLSNFRVPRLAYTFYVRAVRPLRENLQPILYERVGSGLTCSSDPLGLAWMPTSHWRPHSAYVVRMAPIETDTSSPGTARFAVGVARMAVPHFNACPRFSATRTVPVGTLDLSF
jgi:hypothetical protein